MILQEFFVTKYFTLRFTNKDKNNQKLIFNTRCEVEKRK